MNPSDFTLRPSTESDRTYLVRLFYLTDVFGDETRPVGETFPQDLDVYVNAWEPGQGGIIALSPEGIPAGGVWLRAGVEKRPVYGFVDAAIPELAIAVEGRYAGRGLGSLLIRAMLEQARASGCPGVSLAVDAGNDRARRLYLKLGFEVVERSSTGGESMLHRF